MEERCGFILNEPLLFGDEHRCGRAAIKPMRLPSGKVVAWLCVDHAYVADV